MREPGRLSYQAYTDLGIDKVAKMLGRTLSALRSVPAEHYQDWKYLDSSFLLTISSATTWGTHFLLTGLKYTERLCNDSCCRNTHDGGSEGRSV